MLGGWDNVGHYQSLVTTQHCCAVEIYLTEKVGLCRTIAMKKHMWILAAVIAQVNFASAEWCSDPRFCEDPWKCWDCTQRRIEHEEKQQAVKEAELKRLSNLPLDEDLQTSLNRYWDTVAASGLHYKAQIQLIKEFRIKMARIQDERNKRMR